MAEVAGTYVPASPLRVFAPDGSQTSTATSAPHLVGEDTEDVLAAAGFSATEIAAFAAEGII